MGLRDALGVDRVELAPDEATRLDAHLSDATLVVDGLFGTGLDRPITGGYAGAIAALEAAEAPVVSLDVPSGLDADTGAPRRLDQSFHEIWAASAEGRKVSSRLVLPTDPPE